MPTEWILVGNIIPFLDILGCLVGAELDDADIEVITAGLMKSDSEGGHWFELALSGFNSVKVKIAIKKGTSIAFISTDGRPEIRKSLSAVILLLQRYRLTR
jgi:hypothetical protein